MRRAGHYGVRIGNEWHAAKFSVSGEISGWYITGFPNCYKDSAFDEINPKPLHLEPLPIKMETPEEILMRKYKAETLKFSQLELDVPAMHEYAEQVGQFWKEKFQQVTDELRDYRIAAEHDDNELKNEIECMYTREEMEEKNVRIKELENSLNVTSNFLSSMRAEVEQLRTRVIPQRNIAVKFLADLLPELRRHGLFTIREKAKWIKRFIASIPEPAPRKKPKWLPIKDAPKDQMISVKGSTGFAYSAEWSEENQQWHTPGRPDKPFTGKLTHYHELPPQPTPEDYADIGIGDKYYMWLNPEEIFVCLDIKVSQTHPENDILIHGPQSEFDGWQERSACIKVRS